MSSILESNPYDVLRITPQTSKEEIRKAYARSSRGRAERAAHDILVSPEKRLEIDIFLPECLTKDVGTPTYEPREVDWLGFVDLQATVSNAADALIAQAVEAAVGSFPRPKPPVWTGKIPTPPSSRLLLPIQLPLRRKPRLFTRIVALAAIPVYALAIALFASSFVISSSLPQRPTIEFVPPNVVPALTHVPMLPSIPTMEFTSTFTATRTPTTTPTATPTDTYTPTATPTSTPTATCTPTTTLTPTPTDTYTPTATPTSTPTVTRTSTPRTTLTPSPIPTLTGTPGNGAMYTVTSAQPVNVRSCASTTCSIIAVLEPGSQVKVLERVTGETVFGSEVWYRLNYNGLDGYIHSALVSK